MADITTKKILQLLRADAPPELRCAAAQVLAEVGVRDASLDRVLCEALEDADLAFRLHIMEAIGKLRIEAALPKLLERVTEGGTDSEAAAQAAACLGAKGTRSLRGLMGKTQPGLRRRIAAALASGGTTSAESAAVDSLLDSDPGLVDAVARSLVDKIPSLSAAHRRSLVEQLLETLNPAKKAELSLPSEAALLRLLAATKDSRGEAAFWARVDVKQPAELRAAALQALGALPPPNGQDKIKRLLACATDTDFRVAAPALMMLKTVPVAARSLKDWLPLFDAPDVAARRFAIEKLADMDQADVAAALLRQLDQRDRALCEAAMASLARLQSGRAALVSGLLEAKTVEDAWTMAKLQMPFVSEIPAASRASIFTSACAYLDAGDRRADALLSLLSEGTPRDLRDRLEERALALRKKKDYTKAHIYLRLLTRDPACVDSIRFEQAACSLKLSKHDASAEARASDASLQQFAGLLHRHETPPLAMLEKAKWLEPEDLFHLGFHFAEGKGREKEFGAQVLGLLVRRSPKSKLAKDAKHKLRSEGA